VKLTTHLILVPRLRMYGALQPLPHTSSWRDAKLSSGKFHLYLYLLIYWLVDCLGGWVIS